MRISQTPFYLILCYLFLSLAVHAEPDNVMVEDLTFQRPDHWKWSEPPATSPALTRFTIPDSTGAARVDVRFYLKSSVAAEKAALRRDYPQSQPGDLHEEVVTIGKRKITYWEITGTYVYQSHQPQLDRLWVSAAIPAGKSLVYIRIHGLAAETTGQIAIFKKMVEEAVTEREKELAGS